MRLGRLFLAAFVVLGLGSMETVAQTMARDELRELSAEGARQRDAGKAEEALSTAERVYQAAKASLPPGDSDLLTYMSNFAFMLEAAGRLAEAEPLFVESLKWLKETKPVDDTMVVATIDHLGQFFANQGRDAEAEPLLVDALALRRKALGSEHRDTLASINSLGTLYWRNGRYAEADPLYREAAATWQRVYGPDDSDTLVSLNNLATLVEAQGAIDEAESIYRDVIDRSMTVFGKDDIFTLTNRNNLANLLRARGRYGEAEPIYVDVLAKRRRTLGNDDPETIWSIADLASVYVDLGRYPEAEPLFREALDRRRKIFGEVHPDTLSSLQNLGALFEAVGRYADADQVYRQVLEKRRASLGDVHPDTLGSALGLGRVLSQESRFGEAEVLLKSTIEAMRTAPRVSQSDLIVGLNDLAALYVRQSRHKEAETLFREVLERNRALLGDDHSNTLTSFNNLGFVLGSQDRLAEAEPIYREALDRRRRVLGQHHPETLVSINNLGLLLLGMDRLADAEPLLKEALDKSSEILGDNHPNTIITLQNFGFLLEKLGRPSEAEPIYRLALERMRSAQGEDHPSTVEIEMNLVDILIQQRRTDEAVALLDHVGQSMLRRTSVELSSTRQERVRRLMLERQSKYQNTVIALAKGTRAPTALRLAADVILRFKGLAGEQEGFIAQLMNRATDERVVAAAREILNIRGALAAAFHQDADAVPPLLAKLEDAEGRLSSISIEFREAQSEQTATSMDVEKALPEGSVLVEFRLYQLFEDDAFGPPRIAAVLLSHDRPPRFADLGPVAEAEAALKALNGSDESLSMSAAEQLSGILLGAFKSELKTARRVYVAPDGVLTLVPFAQLPFDDANWIATQDVRIVQSGRVLIHARETNGSGGLVAVGGIDYDRGDGDVMTIAASDAGADISDDVRAFTDAGDALRRSLANFRPLPNSGLEIDFITGLYRIMREGEKITVWEGIEAREGRIKSLAEPPRVLHLATHGFYLASKGDAERPMLLSGLPLAGANRGLAGSLDADGEDGILYALEAMGLNLHGSELVVLSACDTAKGTIDYSEGVYGLSRAFRIAGASNILMTLWPLYDTRAREFMEDFYTLWLREYDDPADALIATQRYWAASSDPQRSDPIAWAPFVLVQNGL